MQVAQDLAVSEVAQIQDLSTVTPGYPDRKLLLTMISECEQPETGSLGKASNRTAFTAVGTETRRS
jgi:hypothetical protein